MRARQAWIADQILAALADFNALTIAELARPIFLLGPNDYVDMRNYQAVRLVLLALERDGLVDRMKGTGPGASDLWGRTVQPDVLAEFESEFKAR